VGVLVTNAQYEQVFAKRMLLRSRGKVSFHYSVPSLANLFVDTYAVDQGQRKCIAKPFADSSDRFEQYLGRCLETSLPWSLVEGFESALSLYRKFWADFPQLKYVISENLYQQDSLPRAVCAELGVELITLPHFFPLEIFAGSRLTGLQVQDRFIARGSRQLSKSTIGSGTVFPYRLAGNAEQKEIDTLYVATDFYAYFRSLQQSADGCGYDVYKQFKQFVGDFLEAMPRCAIEKIALKNRPSHSLNPLQLDYPSEMKLLDSSRSAKAYMSRAKLIVVEGMSTTMFEALASNIPTIAFWPADLYQLRPEFVSYFSVLEKAGIVVHDPIELAQQTQIAQQDAKTWWMSGEKQAARAQFLEENLHGQDHFEKLLLSLIRGQSALPEDGRSGRQYPPN
jgi:putative transferase (TIGR04331 family)